MTDAHRRVLNLKVDNFDAMPRRCKELLFDIMFSTDDVQILKKGIVEDIFGLYFFDFSSCDNDCEKIFNFAYDIVWSNFRKKLGTFMLEYHPVIDIDNKKIFFNFMFKPTEDNKKTLLIDCNGYDYFKSKGKKPDAKQDDKIRKAGYEIIHFSESEIYNNPILCVVSTVDTYCKINGEDD